GGVAPLGADEMERALGESEGGVREQAIRLAEPRLAGSEQLFRAVLERSDDPDPRVRFQLALTLGEIRGDATFQTAVRMTAKNAGDGWIRAALLTSAAHAPVEWIAALRRDAASFLDRPGPGALDLVRALAQAVAAERSEARAAAWLREAVGGDRPRAWQREALSCLGPLRRAGMNVDALF